MLLVLSLLLLVSLLLCISSGVYLCSCVSLMLCISAVTVLRFCLLASCDLTIEGALPLLLSVDPADANFLAVQTSLKVHKIENFSDSDLGFCVISLLVMSKY